MDYVFQKLNKKHVILLMGYGAEKDTRLHRADTGTPVRRRNTTRLARSLVFFSAGAFNYHIICVLLKNQKNIYIYSHGGICFEFYYRVSKCSGK